MILLRSLLFNLAFYLWTALLGILALPLVLAPRRVVARFGRWWSASALGLLRVIAGTGYEVRGRENLPPGAAIIAMKHQSAWDTLAAPVIFDDPAVVAKRELLWIPAYGWYARKAGTIPIDRKGGAAALKAMVARSRATAAQGRSIVIFPEGTRRPVGAPPAYQPGVAALYGQLGLPLVPVAVNSGLYWRRRSFIRRPGRIIVEILPAIPPGLPRRQVMAALEHATETAAARLAGCAGVGDRAVDISAPPAGEIRA